MKRYYVSWDERHSMVVSAKNEKEAREIIFNGEFNFEEATAEYMGNEYAELVSNE